MFNTIINWSVAAILASFTIMPISLNRQSAPAVEPITEEAELKGCASNFLKADQVAFRYTETVYDQPSVTNPNHWELMDPEEIDCSGLAAIPCVILVHESYETTNGKLDPSINLTAQLSSNNNYYIVGSADPNIDIFNKSL